MLESIKSLLIKSSSQFNPNELQKLEQKSQWGNRYYLAYNSSDHKLYMKQLTVLGRIIRYFGGFKETHANYLIDHQSDIKNSVRLKLENTLNLSDKTSAFIKQIFEILPEEKNPEPQEEISVVVVDTENVTKASEEETKKDYNEKFGKTFSLKVKDCEDSSRRQLTEASLKAEQSLYIQKIKDSFAEMQKNNWLIPPLNQDIEIKKYIEDLSTITRFFHNLINYNSRRDLFNQLRDIQSHLEDALESAQESLLDEQKK